MSYNVNTWKLSRNNNTIAQVLNFVPGIEQTKIIQKALSGDIYVQTIGRGTKYANMEILVTADELRLVNTAESDGALVSAIYKNVKYLGLIQDPPEWVVVRHGEWYSTTIKLLIEAEVVV